MLSYKLHQTYWLRCRSQAQETDKLDTTAAQLSRRSLLPAVLTSGTCPTEA